MFLDVEIHHFPKKKTQGQSTMSKLTAFLLVRATWWEKRKKDEFSSSSRNLDSSN